MINKFKIAPSILAANFCNLEDELNKIHACDIEYLHFDIMDGSFVPNISFGSHLIKALRPKSNLIFDAHLMIESPDKFLEEFAKVGADIITIHPQTTKHPHRTISTIKSLGKKAGIALNPSTNPDIIDYLIDELDQILIMTVNPGFCGQEFIISQLKKIEIVKNKIIKSGKEILLQVDGGINEKNANLIINAGADIIVLGSYFFKNSNYLEQVNKIYQAVNNANS